jgi:hypothetical protein
MAAHARNKASNKTDFMKDLVQVLVNIEQKNGKIKIISGF